MSKKSPKVDGFLRKPKPWRDEFVALREIILDRDLTEDVKWGWPCYSLDGKNIVLMHGFKEYCALLFFKGALMKDTKSLLIQQTENVQSGRQIRFTSVQEIAKLKSALKGYLDDAIRVEKAGLKVEMKTTKDYPVPEEFQLQLDEMPELKTAFAALTPGRQRGYLYFFAGAKQSKTRAARVEKYLQHILAGKGIDDE
jgi:uncharacterized protein YdeI (YjbR/CyaY-like superfamily)